MRSTSRFVVIGGGIIGISIARALALRGVRKIKVLEQESSVGQHASGRNSGVIHSGINQKPGSLKATMCVEGSRLLREYCLKHQVPMKECGTLVVAIEEREVPVLEQLLKMGKECGVPGLEIIDSKELRRLEPFANGIQALLSPTGATVDSRRVVEALAAEAKELGVEIAFNQRVERIEGKKVFTKCGAVEFDFLINCAGLHADEIAHQMGAGAGYRVIPFRGEYMEVRECDVRSMIYRAPDLRFPFLSIHLTRETDGRVLAGPSAVLAFGKEAYEKEWKLAEMFGMFLSPQFLRLIIDSEFLKLAVNNAKTSLFPSAFLKEIQALVTTSLNRGQITPFRAGIRAQLVDSKGKMVNDILVERQENALHVLNAVSPGFTSSLAFSEYILGSIDGF